MKLSVLQKETELSKNTQPGISYYYSTHYTNPFVTTLNVPVAIKPKLSLISSYIYLPRGHNNNLKLIILGFLEVAFDRTHSHILYKIKQHLFDNQTTLTYLSKNQIPEKIRSYYTDDHLKKVLMQFFHLMTSHQYPSAHLYYFIQTYPTILFILELLFRKILALVGINAHEIWKQQISTPVILESLSKHFDCLFERAEENVYWIARKVVFLEDKSTIYKNKFDQQGSEKMLVNIKLQELEQLNDTYKIQQQLNNKILTTGSRMKSQQNSRIDMDSQIFNRIQIDGSKQKSFMRKQKEVNQWFSKPQGS